MNNRTEFLDNFLLNIDSITIKGAVYNRVGKLYKPWVDYQPENYIDVFLDLVL